MAGRTVQMGYLFHIELIKKSCLDETSAITGQELFRRLNTIPLSYRRKWAPWFGYDFLMVADWARNLNDTESLDFLLEQVNDFPDSMFLVTDSTLSYERTRTFFTARYWLHNVKEKGQQFSSGIEERNIEWELAMIGDYPLQGLTELSQLTDDYALWNYVKTWLDGNWRRPDQITTKSSRQIREEYYKRMGTSTT